PGGEGAVEAAARLVPAHAALQTEAAAQVHVDVADAQGAGFGRHVEGHRPHRVRAPDQLIDADLHGQLLTRAPATQGVLEHRWFDQVRAIAGLPFPTGYAQALRVDDEWFRLGRGQAHRAAELRVIGAHNPVD